MTLLTRRRQKNSVTTNTNTHTIVVLYSNAFRADDHKNNGSNIPGPQSGAPLCFVPLSSRNTVFPQGEQKSSRRQGKLRAEKVL